MRWWVALAVLACSDGSANELVDFGLVDCDGEPRLRTRIVENDSSKTAHFTTTWEHGDSFIATPAAGLLGPNEKVTITITARSFGDVERNGTVVSDDLAISVGEHAKHTTVRATASGPSCERWLSTDAIDFGFVACGAPLETRTLTVTNTSEVPADLKATTEGPFTIEMTSATVPSHGVMTITVRMNAFPPSASTEVDAYSNKIHIAMSGKERWVPVHLSAKGARLVMISPPLVNVGPNGVTEIRIRNDGNATGNVVVQPPTPAYCSVDEAGAQFTLIPGAELPLTLRCIDTKLEPVTATLVLNAAAGDIFCAAPDVKVVRSLAVHVRSLHVGYFAACAIDDVQGRAYCWGQNESGTLVSTAQALVPTVIPVGSSIESVQSTAWDSWMLKENGTVWQWTKSSSGPNQVSDASGYVIDATKLSAGATGACFMHQSGETQCTSFSSGFGHAPLLDDAKVLAVGGGNVECAITSADTVKCLGYSYANLGLSNAVALAASDGNACAVMSSGSVACWGGNQHGQLGTASTATYSDTPVTIGGISDAVGVTLAGQSACALGSTGDVVCWGQNNVMQLGSGSTDSKTPVAVAVSNVAMISGGGNMFCALLNTKTIKCWGASIPGDGNTYTTGTGPVDVSGFQ